MSSFNALLIFSITFDEELLHANQNNNDFRDKVKKYQECVKEVLKLIRASLFAMKKLPIVPTENVHLAVAAYSELISNMAIVAPETSPGDIYGLLFCKQPDICRIGVVASRKIIESDWIKNNQDFYQTVRLVTIF